MKIITTYFERDIRYRKLLNVFYNSAKEKMPAIPIEVLSFQPPVQKYTTNEINNHHWDTYYAFMAKINHALITPSNVLMADNDLIFLNSVEDVWKKDFDVAITVRNHRCRYNTGVCFARDTIAAKYFLTRWKDNTCAVANRFDLREIQTWWGIDQASLNLTIKEGIKLKLLELPCQEWNAEQTNWRNVTTRTKIVHIKSGLRRIVFGLEKMNPRYYYLKPIVERIGYYENTKECFEFHRPAAVRA